MGNQIFNGIPLQKQLRITYKIKKQKHSPDQAFQHTNSQFTDTKLKSDHRDRQIKAQNAKKET